MKTINELDKFCNADTGEVDAVGIYTLRESAIEDVKEIQKGSGLNRDLFPESMKGEIAKDNWNNSIFSYGMEYGYLLCLIEKFCLTEEDIKEDVK